MKDSPHRVTPTFHEASLALFEFCRQVNLKLDYLIRRSPMQMQKICTNSPCSSEGRGGCVGAKVLLPLMCSYYALATQKSTIPYHDQPLTSSWIPSSIGKM